MAFLEAGENQAIKRRSKPLKYGIMFSWRENFDGENAKMRKYMAIIIDIIVELYWRKLLVAKSSS